jgi:hypothetical protein
MLNIIITHQRVGSTWLINLLENQFSSYEELFLSKCKKWPTNVGLKNIYTYSFYVKRVDENAGIIKRIKILNRYINYLTKLNCNEKVVFKIMASQILKYPELLLLLFRYRRNTLYFFRRNYRATYLSQIAKKKVGFSHNLKITFNIKNKITSKHKLSVTNYYIKFTKRLLIVRFLNLIYDNSLLYEDLEKKDKFKIFNTIIIKEPTVIKKMNLDYIHIFANYQEFIKKTNRAVFVR